MGLSSGSLLGHSSGGKLHAQSCMACRVLVNVVNAVREVNWAQGTHGVAGVFIRGNYMVTNADAALCHHRGSGQADFGSCPGVVPRCKARELSALLWVAFLVR